MEGAGKVAIGIVRIDAGSRTSGFMFDSVTANRARWTLSISSSLLPEKFLISPLKPNTSLSRRRTLSNMAAEALSCLYFVSFLKYKDNRKKEHTALEVGPDNDTPYPSLDSYYTLASPRRI
jgi:hypothetical protein